MHEIIRQLNEKRAAARLGGGQKRIDAQHAKGGIFAAAEENLTTEERVARLRQKMLQASAEKNGAHPPD